MMKRFAGFKPPQNWIKQIGFFFLFTKVGSGALYVEVLLVRIIENNKIDIYYRADKDKSRLTLPP